MDVTGVITTVHFILLRRMRADSRPDTPGPDIILPPAGGW